MNFPSAYVKFLFHFHGDRDYFECHEVLEEHWKRVGMERNSIWVSLIQIAVSFYHYRRGNMKGAMKLIDKSLRQLTYKQEELQSLGIHHEQLLFELETAKLKINANLPYEAINLPINNIDLLLICLEYCDEQGFKWGKSRDNAPYQLIHKHKLRDRSSIIANRQFALAGKGV